MRFCLILILVLMHSGCASRIYVPPTTGTLATVDFYFPGTDWTSVVGVFEDGENCKGLKYVQYLANLEKISVTVNSNRKGYFFVATNSPRQGAIYQNWSHCSTAMAFQVAEERYEVYSGIRGEHCIFNVSAVTVDGKKYRPDVEYREYVQDSFAGLDSLSYCKE
ncbi:MAG TPA: hypothetical protein VF268_10055 [Gammaproteobacteria bacterium]